MKNKNIIADEQEVLARIVELAEHVIDKYKDSNPLFICLLRGGIQFASLFMFSITKLDPEFHPEMHYMAVQTYGEKRESDGVKFIYDLQNDINLTERKIILLDDVLDTGETAHEVTEHLKLMGAGSVDLIVLVQKTKTREYWQNATLFGFKTHDVWLSGMGMDDTSVNKEAFRWSQQIAIAGNSDII